MARYLERNVDFEEVEELAGFPGELPMCRLCGQRPDSITFSSIDCKAGCLMQLELVEPDESRQSDGPLRKGFLQVG
jgi:hypothetical protein